MKFTRFSGLLLGTVLLLQCLGCSSVVQRADMQPAPIREAALHAYRVGDLLTAESLLIELTRAHPRDADSWFLLANLYLRTGQYEAAIPAYQQAARIKPQQAQIWHNLALVHIRLATQSLLHGMQHTDDDFAPLLGWLLEVQGAAD